MKYFWLLLFVSLLFRLILIPQPGFEADVSYWKFWGLTAADKGVIWLANNTNYNYPAGFAWVLWLIGKTYRLLGNPEDFQQFWSSNNYLFLFLAKLPSILADLGVAIIVARWSSILAVIYLFHPAVWFDGAWWGQVDSLLIFFLIGGLYCLERKRTLLATGMIMIGFLMKFQMMVVLPLYFLFILRRHSWQELGKNLLVAAGIFLLGNLPFILTNNLPTVISLITRNADWFPVLSLRAFNLWWLYSKGQGLTASDKILVFGPLNAKMAGLFLFSLTYGLACLLVYLKPNFKNLLLSLILAVFSFFIFPTQGHDRYILPALILLLVSLKHFHQRLFLWLFGLLSLTTILNLNLSMLAEYPKSGLPLISWFNFPSLSLIIASANLLLYLIYLGFILKTTYLCLSKSN